MAPRGSLKKGDNVLVNVPPQQNNGDPEALGVVVRAMEVNSEDDGKESRANVRVFLDGEETLLLRNVLVLNKAPKDDEDRPTGNYAVRA